MATNNNAAIGGLIGTGVGAAYGGPLGAQVGGSIGGLAGSMFGGDDGVSQEALNMLREAQARIMAIPQPTADDLKLILTPLMQQGVLTPEQYQTISSKPSDFTNINLDPTSREAETGALNQLQDIGNAGGQDAEFRAAMNEARNSANTTLQGQRGAIMQNAAERGATNSNLTAANQLAQASQDAYNLNSQTTQAASDAEARALQAIQGSASLAGNINSQDYQQASDRAKAIDAINAYNAQNAQAQSSANTSTANSAQQYNLGLKQNIAQYNNQNTNDQSKYNAALPQQVFQNKLAQAGAAAGVALPTANLLQKGNENNSTLQGTLIGGLGQGISSYYNNKNLTTPLKTPATPTATPAASVASTSSAQSDPFDGNPYQIPGQGNGWAHGGEIPGRAPVPGDSPANDIIPARLSPGEVIVPRSAAHDPALLAEFVRHAVATRKPDIHPDDVKNVLHALTQYRNGGVSHA